MIFPVFPREKLDESFRTVLNRKKVKKNTQKVDFEMETMTFILKLITLNMYFRKIDLKDAYILSQYIKTAKNSFAWRKLHKCSCE